MDPIILGFYAIVCGLLSWIAPQLGTPFVRFGIGALVGIFAAGILPLLRSGIGI